MQNTSHRARMVPELRTTLAAGRLAARERCTRRPALETGMCPSEHMYDGSRSARRPAASTSWDNEPHHHVECSASFGSCRNGCCLLATDSAAELKQDPCEPRLETVWLAAAACRRAPRPCPYSHRQRPTSLPVDILDAFLATPALRLRLGETRRRSSRAWLRSTSSNLTARLRRRWLAYRQRTRDVSPASRGLDTKRCWCSNHRSHRDPNWVSTARGTDRRRRRAAAPRVLSCYRATRAARRGARWSTPEHYAPTRHPPRHWYAATAAKRPSESDAIVEAR
jgi:hypothetical protein